MELLLEYRRITQEQEDVKENQMSCIKNLLDFYDTKHIDRRESYIKYLRKLSALHEECKNWAEASFTLLQYAKLLKWDESRLTEADCWDPSKTIPKIITETNHIQNYEPGTEIKTKQNMHQTKTKQTKPKHKLKQTTNGTHYGN